MNRFVLHKEIEQLINSSPLDYVDVAAIISKYSVGKDFEEQAHLRSVLVEVLEEMRRSEVIDFSDSVYRLNGSAGREFISNYGMIRSTMKYEKEKQQNKFSSSVHVGGNFVGNVNTGNVQGGLQQNNSGTLTLGDNQINELRSYGVEEKDIESLKEIVKDSPDKPSYLEQSMGWLGNVSASIAATGIYEHLPAIHHFVKELGKQLFG